MGAFFVTFGLMGTRMTWIGLILADFLFITHVTRDWNADDADNADIHGF